MNQLIFFLVLGGLLFIFSLLALFFTPGRKEPADEAMETLLKMVPLPGLDFRHPAALFDDSDCRWISEQPGRVAIAEQLRRDRRHLALSWLKQLQADVLALWRFRRLLTTFGVPSSIREEFATAGKAASVLLLLFGLRCFVALFGPFSIGPLAASIRSRVQGFSQVCGATLGRVPMYRLAQLESYWRSMEAAHTAS